MLQSFFKQKPTGDTPYRELVIERNPWRVRLSGGTVWGQGYSKEIKVIQAKSFNDAKDAFDKLFRELQDEGWKPYSPCEPW